jgi:DNA-binding transcriptional LysR family regulator
MARELTLRQIEGFMAVVETGTISAAALQLRISQPAMSKLIAHLEEDAGLALFDRTKRRLALTDRGTRFYDEIDRIFSGVRQVQKVAEVLRREDQGQITIGVMPALAGAFIQRSVSNFLRERPKVFCSVQSHTSAQITELLATRRLDIGLVNGRVENRYIVSDNLLELPLVCIMPLGHPLEEKAVISPEDLDGHRFVAFDTDNVTGKRVADMMDAHKVRIDVVLVSNLSTTVCEFVAAGEGVSLIHPLFMSGFEQRLSTRPFNPATPYHFQICRPRENRNTELVQQFLKEMRKTATEICESIRNI